MPDKYASQARYDAANTTRITIKLNLKTDADILQQLEKADSKAGLIKSALRAYNGKERSMREYRVKREYADNWLVHGDTADEVIVGEQEITRLAAEWGVDLFDLLREVDIDENYMAAAVALMDDEIREDIHREGTCDTDAQFLYEYEKRHLAKYGKEFTV